MASDSDGSKEVNIRILFDSDSQRSYITEAIKTKLGLRSIKKETLHLNTFGNDKYQTQMCDTVQVLIKKLGGDEVVKVEVLCFPTICTPLPPILEVNHYPGLRDLELADNFAETGDAIDLLVGSDYYWAFVTREVTKLKFSGN